MTQVHEVRAAAAPMRGGGARGFIRWVCTNNPFYVISAGLFLAGLRVSFGDPTEAADAWGMMAGLAGYTLLLAVTACLLVRFAKVWDDVRTVLLLVVLMFLATSVTFDEVLIANAGRGTICCLVGLLFALLISDGALRGMRLTLPMGFRLPYYLMLALFFLYPLGLRQLSDAPHSPALLWSLFGFASAAGLIFLTLLPAIRRGPDYVAGNGSPWRWPQYPWSLFVFLGVAVVGRSALLCYSMHQLENGARDQLVFGPYFLVPFGLALAVLLLEMGLVSGRRVVLWCALALPLGLIVLARVGHRADPTYEEFLTLFTTQLGGDPVFVTLCAATLFWFYAVLRRAPLAVEALTAGLAALAVVSPEIVRTREFGPFQPAPLLAAGMLQLALGLWQHASWRCLLGGVSLAVGAAGMFPGLAEDTLVRGPIVFHIALAALLFVGAVFDDRFARVLRVIGVQLVILAGIATLFFPVDLPGGVPAWALDIYPLVMAGLIVGYGWFLGSWTTRLLAIPVVACWLLIVGWRGYLLLRVAVAGIDYLALSLLLFAVAVLVSLAKAGIVTRWMARRTDWQSVRSGRDGLPIRPTVD